jgi:hypothetical protein
MPGGDGPVPHRFRATGLITSDRDAERFKLETWRQTGKLRIVLSELFEVGSQPGVGVGA